MSNQVYYNRDLFELCREVNEFLPDYNNELYRMDSHDGLVVRWGTIPLYTSDYLLEKLPATIGRYGTKQYLRMAKTDKGYSFCYMNYLDLVPELEHSANTPLKALLKLTIALHEAGELK